ncbi:DUF397 domain-containing protein [Actinomadura mexicana]|uniref:DUF397 domain-containing protein n=1 Tax=Actinomadura mexicana TaxID=134959 RepID=A0A238YEY3_9ACTN|nr:DUF397 domain-containing protein [Actinomadura mexicana]SNR69620.1 protein of unknown function [Actinomadura mexicana]
MDLNELHWRKASHSASNGGECVEVADLGRGVGVRDSKDPAGGHLAITPESFRALIAELKR